MKKFMTVLLVIAVMFTFSFSTAFADVATSSEAAQIKAAGAYAQAATAATVEQAIKAVLGATTNNVKYISAEAWDAAAADIVKDINDKIQTGVENYLANSALLPAGWDAYPSDMNYTATVMFGDYYKTYVQLAAELNAQGNAYALKAAAEQFEIDFNKALTVYDEVDLAALYSTTVAAGETKSNYEKAEDFIKADKETLKAFYFDADGEVQHINNPAAVDGFKAEAEFVKAAVNAGGKSVGGKAIKGVSAKYYTANGETLDVVEYYYIAGIDTIVDDAADDAAKAATVAAVKAQIAANLANYAKDPAYDADFAKTYAEVYNFLAEKKTTETAAKVAAHKDVEVLKVAKADREAALEAAIKAVAELEGVAAKYVAEKDATGAAVRDAAAVEKLVAEAKVSEYAFAALDIAKTKSATEAANTIAAMNVADDAAKLAFDKEAKKADLAADLEALEDSYYELEYAAVKAAYEVAYAEVDACEKADWTKVDKNLKTAVDKIKKTGDVDKLFEGAKMAAELEKQAKSVKAYLDYANLNNVAYEDAYMWNPTSVEAVEAALQEMYIEAGVRTLDEMKAAPVTAEAFAATVPTTGALNAAEAAAKAAVKALPSKITAADMAAVVAAYEAIDAYDEMLEAAVKAASGMTVKTQADAVKAAFTNDIKLAYAKADKTDKAAMKALAAEIEAANEALADVFEAYTIADIAYQPVETALEKIQETEYKAVIAAINAIPFNVTEADKATVEAARALYEAYVEEYTDYDNNRNVNGSKKDGFVADDFAPYYSEMYAAEVALGLNAEDPAYSVEALKIVAKSSAKKGSITVKWTVEGDTSAVEGYEIWKSTKHSSGYKKMFTTTKMTYKNTKGLEKGTRYYYKVRAIAHTAEGVKVKSDFSNKARRIAK